jgi:ParB family chromosome partitioning protein
MKNKKWEDPLEKLLNAEEKISTIDKWIKNEVDSNKIHEVDPNIIFRWEGKDRPENELGNIEALATSLKDIGQQVPCIVRPIKNNKYDYELIVGECRWRASIKAKIKLKVIIKKLNDRDSSLIQAVENEQRNNLSDYAKGMSYAKKISEGLLYQKDLTNILNISKQQVTKLLSFNKIPKKLHNEIKDFRKVSARTAYEISRLGNKSKEYEDILISISDKIRDGKIGSSGIINHIKNTENKTTIINETIESKYGKLNLKHDGKKYSVIFPNAVSEKIGVKKMKDIIEKVIKNI